MKARLSALESERLAVAKWREFCLFLCYLVYLQYVIYPTISHL
jgi:hypothetical protein